MTSSKRVHCGRRIPLAVKVLYTLFICVLVPKYWIDYGPTNFLYFCDIALLITVPALWLENALLASMASVGIVLPQILWQVDFLGGVFGCYVTGMTKYMADAFESHDKFFLRGLSFFHFWLPFLLLYMVWRLGYDRRAFLAWTLLAWVVLLICYFAMPAPPLPESNPNLPVNINYVYGLDDSKPPQTWMPQIAWLGLLMVGMPLLLFLPTHALLTRAFRSAPAAEPPVSENLHESAG